MVAITNILSPHGGPALLDQPRGTPTFLYGTSAFLDVNGDNVVSEIDALEVADKFDGHSGSLTLPHQTPSNPLDVNNDGLVNSEDEQAILHYLANLAISQGVPPVSSTTYDNSILSNIGQLTVHQHYPENILVTDDGLINTALPQIDVYTPDDDPAPSDGGAPEWLIQIYDAEAHQSPYPTWWYDGIGAPHDIDYWMPGLRESIDPAPYMLLDGGVPSWLMDLHHAVYNVAPYPSWWYDGIGAPSAADLGKFAYGLNAPFLANSSSKPPSAKLPTSASSPPPSPPTDSTVHYLFASLFADGGPEGGKGGIAARRVWNWYGPPPNITVTVQVGDCGPLAISPGEVPAVYGVDYTGPQTFTLYVPSDNDAPVDWQTFPLLTNSEHESPRVFCAGITHAEADNGAVVSFPPQLNAKITIGDTTVDAYDDDLQYVPHRSTTLTPVTNDYSPIATNHIGAWDIFTPFVTSFTQPAHGVIEMSYGALVYTPNPDYTGPDSFTYVASNGLSSATATVHLTPTPQLGIQANDDTIKFDPGSTSVTFSTDDLLANDSAPAGTSLSFLDFSSQPKNGQLIDNQNGTWTYVPNTGFFGTDDWYYRVTGAGNTAKALVSITTELDGSISGRFYAWAPTAGPLADLRMPHEMNATPGIGIRRNGDSDNNNPIPDYTESNVANENDLIPIDLIFSTQLSAIIAAGYSISLVRSSEAIQLWDVPTKQTAYYPNNVADAILSTPPDGTVFRFYVEWKSMNLTVTSANLDLEAKKNGQTIILDRITFHPFKSEVILFNGEFQTPGNQSDGITQIAQKLRGEGYDAFIFDEDDVGVDTDFQCSIVPGIDGDVIQFYDPGPQQDGERNSLAEIVNAVAKRGVKEVSIIGYSHGGGATFVLSQLLQATFGVAYQNFDLKFTAYIDAVAKRSVLAQTLRPNESEFHLNLYQDGIGNLGGPWRFVQGGPLNDLMPGDLEDNVDSGADGGIGYVAANLPDRLHTNRQTISGKRGIAEAGPVQDKVVDTLKDKMKPF